MTQTLDLGMMGQVVYHCAISMEKYKKALVLFSNIRLGRKGLSGTNTLTYTITSSGMKKKCYNTECRRESGSISLTITCRCVFFHLNCKNAKWAAMLTTQKGNFTSEIE
jgi:hypothetical protein